MAKEHIKMSANILWANMQINRNSLLEEKIIHEIILEPIETLASTYKQKDILELT